MNTTKPRILSYEIGGTGDVVMRGDTITLTAEIEAEKDFSLGIELKNIETGEEHKNYAYIRRIKEEKGKIKTTLKAQLPYYIKAGKYKITKIYVNGGYDLATQEIEVVDGEVLTIENF